MEVETIGGAYGSCEVDPALDVGDPTEIENSVVDDLSELPTSLRM